MHNGKKGVQFRVESKKELFILIDHLDKYPLITKKSKDFLWFKKAISLIKNKEHLTKKRFTKFSDLKDKFLPILHLQHPIVGYKYLDSLFFMQAVEMMKKKIHLTEKGLNKLREIQLFMNSGRNNTPPQKTDSATTD